MDKSPHVNFGSKIAFVSQIFNKIDFFLQKVKFYINIAISPKNPYFEPIMQRLNKKSKTGYWPNFGPKIEILIEKS